MSIPDNCFNLYFHRILTIANTQTLFSMKEQTQQHAWMSEISKIKWISVEIENPSLQGKMTMYNGLKIFVAAGLYT